jgi:6-phosphofructokinase
MDGRGEPHAVDRMLDALGHVERRALPVALLSEDDGAASRVAVEAVDSVDGPEGALIARQHTHCPKLAAEGIVDWDRDANTISKGPNFEAVRPLLERLVDYERERADAPVELPRR